jgi:hypothetical protein
MACVGLQNPPHGTLFLVLDTLQSLQCITQEIKYELITRHRRQGNILDMETPTSQSKNKLTLPGRTIVATVYWDHACTYIVGFLDRDDTATAERYCGTFER